MFDPEPALNSAPSPDPSAAAGSSRSVFLAGVSVIVLLFLIYFLTAVALSQVKNYFDYNNIFFDADQVEALQGWVAFHKGIHPLLLLFVVPLTAFCRFLIHDPVIVTLLVNALFGSVAVSLALIFFWKLTRTAINALLFSLVFALTGSQWIFSSVPDSYSLGAASVIAPFVLLIFCMKDRKLYLPWWIAAGILSFGVTVTNFGTTLICFISSVFFLKVKKIPRQILLYVTTILAVVTILNLAQHVRYPGSKLWYQPEEYFHEVAYMNFDLLKSRPLLVLSEAMKNMFLFDVVLGQPARIVLPRTNGATGWTFFRQLHFQSPWGLPALGLWLIVLTTGILGKFSRRSGNPLLTACCLSIALNLFIHIIYGVNVIFLYSSNFTFAVLLLALPWEEKPSWKTLAPSSLLLVFLALNNASIIRGMIQNFQ
jgi:hypothetical protein